MNATKLLATLGNHQNQHDISRLSPFPKFYYLKKNKLSPEQETTNDNWERLWKVYNALHDIGT